MKWNIRTHFKWFPSSLYDVTIIHKHFLINFVIRFRLWNTFYSHRTYKIYFLFFLAVSHFSYFSSTYFSYANRAEHFYCGRFARLWWIWPIWLIWIYWCVGDGAVAERDVILNKYKLKYCNDFIKKIIIVDTQCVHKDDSTQMFEI